MSVQARAVGRIRRSACSAPIAEAGQIPQRLEPREKEVGPTPNSRERRQTSDAFPDWALGNLVLQCAILCPDDRIALIRQLVKVFVVDPHILSELELADETGADHERCDSSFHTVLWRTFRQGGAIGRTATNHPPPVHVGGGVPGVHPPAMGSERNRIA